MSKLTIRGAQLPSRTQQQTFSEGETTVQPELGVKVRSTQNQLQLRATVIDSRSQWRLRRFVWLWRFRRSHRRHADPWHTQTAQLWLYYGRV